MTYAFGEVMRDRRAVFDGDKLFELLSRARETLKIAVVFGGSKDNPENVAQVSINTRSWKSYEGIADEIASSLKDVGFQSVITMAEGIDLVPRLITEKIDLVWINSGGVQGVDPVSHLPAALEMAGIPYIGHNPVNASLLDNKQLLKWGMESKGIPTAPFFAWHPVQGRFPGIDCIDYQRVFASYDGPFLVKPVSGRASLLIEIIDETSDLPDAIQRIVEETHNAVLVEKYLGGREYTVAVAGPILHRSNHLTRTDKPSVFSQIERHLDKEERFFTSMDAKPITKDRMRLLDPNVEAAEVARLNDLARNIYTGFALETLVRVDVRADEKGDFFVLEANPKPDLKKPTASGLSFVCSGLNRMRMSYGDLLLSIVAQKLYDLCDPKTGLAGPILRKKLGLHDTTLAG